MIQDVETEDEYFDCIIQMSSTPIYHATGTCRMGPPSDANSVVNPDLKVKSFSNLRVADASIMPRIIGGNTHAPTVMIGEKVVEMITADWRALETDSNEKSCDSSADYRREEL